MKAYSQFLQPKRCVSRTFTGQSGRTYHVTEQYRCHNRRSVSRRSELKVQAIEISGPQGSSPAPVVSPDQQKISAELVASMREKIREALQADRVDISDTYGDGRHVSIDVVSKAFEGESSMKRQRMVYRAIWLELQDTVHAVDAMTTRTPEEAGLA